MKNNIISTGFDKLDKIAEKFGDSALIYIAARPGMGLRTFANNLADIIYRTKENCWIFNFDDEDAEKLENKFGISATSKRYAQIDNEPNICTIKIPQYENKPKLSDLQKAGTVLQDADVIMFLHRDDFTINNKDNRDSDITELIIAKNNYGDTGTINLKYDSNEKRFFEADD